MFNRFLTKVPLQPTLYTGTCPYFLVNEIFSAKSLSSSLCASALFSVAMGGEGSAAGCPGIPASSRATGPRRDLAPFAYFKNTYFEMRLENRIISLEFRSQEVFPGNI